MITKKIPLLFIIGVFVFSTFASIFSPVITSVNAQSADSLERICSSNPSDSRCGSGGTLADKKDLDWQIKSMIYYRAIGYCLKNSGASSGTFWGVSDTITKSDAKEGKWFMSHDPGTALQKGFGPNTIVAPVGAYLRGEGYDDADTDVRIGCGDLSAIIKEATTMWGWTRDEAMCAFGYYRLGVAESERKTLCTDKQRGGNDKDWDAGGEGKKTIRHEAFKAAVAKKVYGGTIPDYSKPKYDAFWYKFYLKVFQQACAKGASATQSAKSQYDPDNEESSVYKIFVISNTGVAVHPDGSYYVGTQKRGFDVNTRMKSPDNADIQWKNCYEIEAHINNLAAAFKALAASSPEQVVDNDVEDSKNTAALTEEGAPSCIIENIGWIVCPVIKFTAGLADGAFGFLADNFLRTDPEVFNTDSKTYVAWSVMRTVANVAFVIVFLIIIFSQLTSMGIANYGIKKMLPRLIIAAILVNLSYFISQIAVDLSNILGYSIKDAFEAISGTISGGGSVQEALNNNTSAGFLATGNGFSDIAVGVVSVAAVGVAGYALLSTLIPVILAAVVALVMILFILIARQAIVILLVVISPLAFVAYLLPNTEAMFTKWRKALTAMLLLFPIIAIVFGASSLASTVLLETFTSAGGLDGDDNNMFGQIISAAVLVLPLFVVPTLLKKSLDGIPAIGQIASKWASRANGGVGKSIGNAYKNSAVGIGRETRARARNSFFRQKNAARIEKGGIAGVGAAGIAGLGLTKKQRFQTDALRNEARSIISGGESDEMKHASLALEKEIGAIDPRARDGHLMAIATGVGKTEVEQKAALNHLASTGRDSVLRSMLTSPATSDTSKANIRRAISANAGSLAGKAPDLVKGTNAAFEHVTGAELTSFSKATMQTYMSHLDALAADPARADDYKTAVSGLNSAIEDIHANPSLQASFKADSGAVILDAVKGSANLAADIGHTAGNIGADGKIR